MKLRRLLPTLIALALSAFALFILLHTTLPRLRASRAVMEAGPTRHDGDADDPGTASATGPRPAGPGDATERHGWLQRRLRAALAQGGAVEQSRALLTLIGDLQPGDFPVVVDMARQLWPVSDEPVFEILMGGWTECDPEAAMNYGKDSIELSRYGSATWCARDPEAAFAWAGRHSSFDPLRQASLNLLEKQPDRMGELLGRLEEKDGAELFIHLVGSRHPAAAAEEVFRWVTEIRDPQALDRAMPTFNENWSLAGYQTVFALVLQHPQAFEVHTLGRPFLQWAGIDPAAATHAMEQLPTGRLRSSALGGVLFATIHAQGGDAGVALMNRYAADADEPLLVSWMLSQPAAATQWLDANPQIPADLRARVEKLRRPTAEEE